MGKWFLLPGPQFSHLCHDGIKSNDVFDFIDPLRLELVGPKISSTNETEHLFLVSVFFFFFFFNFLLDFRFWGT